MSIFVLNNVQLPHSDPEAKYANHLKLGVVQILRLSWVLIIIFHNKSYQTVIGQSHLKQMSLFSAGNVISAKKHGHLMNQVQPTGKLHCKFITWHKKLRAEGCSAILCLPPLKVMIRSDFCTIRSYTV